MTDAVKAEGGGSERADELLKKIGGLTVERDLLVCLRIEVARSTDGREVIVTKKRLQV